MVLKSIFLVLLLLTITLSILFVLYILLPSTSTQKEVPEDTIIADREKAYTHLEESFPEIIKKTDKPL